MEGVECGWSWEEDKRFENALAIFPEGCPYRWERIASSVGGKSVEEIKDHYQVLVEDVRLIELGFIELPTYSDDSQRRRHSKPNRWTEEEHRLFLEGLEQCGRGNWKSVSRIVGSRSPSQVTSHAQKYYIRLNSTNKPRFRILDITTAGSPPPTICPQFPQF